MKNLMSENSIIVNRSTLQKSRLSRKDNLMKERLKSGRQDFGDNLIVEIYNTNRPKMMHRRRIIYLRYKSNICVIEFLKHKTSPKKGLHRSNSIASYNRPISFIKKTCHTIRTRMAVKISLSSRIVHKLSFSASKITQSTRSDIPESRDVFLEEKREEK